MTIILRLEGLNAKAGIEDIRHFFVSLDIPNGGVYILGGRLGEAFVAFKSEKDAQFAMLRTGDLLKGSKVTLQISNMAEMEHKLNALLKKKRKPSPTQLLEMSPRPHPDVNKCPLNTGPADPRIADVPPSPAQLQTPTTDTKQILNVNSIDSQTAFLLGICTVIQGLQSSHQKENEAGLSADTPMNDHTVVTNEKWTPEHNLKRDPGYVRLFGLPPSTTKDDICQFFRGLTVQEAIVNVKLGVNYGCLVKFESDQDACSALSFNHHLLGPISVEVRSATEKMWISALQECENGTSNQDSVTPKQSPLRDTLNHKQKAPILPKKRKHLPLKSPKKTKSDHDSTTTQYVQSVVMVRNLPVIITKTEIKELFGCPNIAHRNVLHLLDSEGNRTDTAFLIFNRTEDFEYAMNLNGCHVGSGVIKVSSITREEMNALTAKTHPRNLNQRFKRWNMKKPFQKGNPAAFKRAEVAQSKNVDPLAQTCLFVRNLPANVEKDQIKTFFSEYKLRRDNITLLHDIDGRCIGEAVVQFQSQKTAALAQALHGQDFLGTKVLLTPINIKQMDDILVQNIPRCSMKAL
ncbi:RNA binding motif protein 12Ba [Sphaeramia orbicularis]|uniref:RNA-binding protein 12B-like n=1 Tax=Sphaeramia orbicularis TaxID=375764 RepID=A0A673A320_9TELE|nr:RNA-binding protein 12B-like [Sphaeramia orbicularis]XP_030014482.1 RNA-binding protein 12B-like [Sphaeramia orbicularis]XP_030014483.1 RNA-binding protein 12B-like [Sphaeramia orbicularis]